MKQQEQFILFTREEFGEWLEKQKISRVIKSIQNHHTYEPSYDNFNGSNHFDRLNSMDNYHEEERGWSDIGQNLTTFPDGTIAVCRPLNIAPAGIYGQNTHAICIEHLGNFDIGGDKMTDEHRRTIIYINAVLCKKFNLSINTTSIVYHHWFDLNTGKRLKDNEKGVRKSCCGTNFFGGNKIADCEKNFIPLVKKELEKINSPHNNKEDYEYHKMYKERIYVNKGKLMHCEGDYSKSATDIRFMRFKTGYYSMKFVYETNAKVSSLVKKCKASIGTNAPFFFEGKILGDSEDNDKVISSAHGKLLKWHEFAFVDGKPVIGQLNVKDKQTLLIQGAPLLVNNGRLVYDYYRVQQKVNDDIGKSRCQRTFCWIDTQGDLWFGWSDGRTKSDIGLNLEEMALFALEKKAVTALNLDGGGSTIVADENGGLNQKLNTGKNERVVHHALVFFIDENILKEEYSDVIVTPPKIQRDVFVVVNGKKMTNGLLINGTSYVKLRELGEYLGSVIGWDSVKRQASFNDIPVTSEDSYLIDGVTYIKLRKFSELSGCTVSWDSSTYTATITK